jgi:uncharacterized protein YdhG (YjbR/CyaY superfamily)
MRKQADPVDQYIKGFPEEIQEKLKQLRSIIRSAAPKAEEYIGYGLPGYKAFGKPLVYFAGFKNHIGLYALPSGHSKFKEKLSKYKGGKGSVQFPNDEPLPVALIKQMVVFRWKENREQEEAKAQKPKHDFLHELSAPAKRALTNFGIKSLKDLSRYTEKEILKLHGMGPSSIPKLKAALKKSGLQFKEK